MAATKADLMRWFDRGVAQGATNMVVKCDTFDAARGDADCCYPIYCDSPAEARKKAHDGGDRLMEVYDLTADKDAQFATRARVFNYGDAASCS